MNIEIDQSGKIEQYTDTVIAFRNKEQYSFRVKLIGPERFEIREKRILAELNERQKKALAFLEEKGEGRSLCYVKK